MRHPKLFIALVSTTLSGSFAIALAFARRAEDSQREQDRRQEAARLDQNAEPETPSAS